MKCCNNNPVIAHSGGVKTWCAPLKYMTVIAMIAWSLSSVYGTQMQHVCDFENRSSFISWWRTMSSLTVQKYCLKWISFVGCSVWQSLEWWSVSPYLILHLNSVRTLFKIQVCLPLCGYRILVRTKGTRTSGPKRKHVIASPNCSSLGLRRQVRQSASTPPTGWIWEWWNLWFVIQV